MHPRRLTKTASQKHELEAFAEKYDTLADIYGDPVEMVFKVMSDSYDPEVRLRAAEMLMSYRFPRVKAREGEASKAPVLNFNVTMPKPELEVGPAAPQRAVLTVVTESKSEEAP